RYIVDTTTVVLVPESGDQVQAIKAGLMEIAEIYVLNKADRPDAATALNRISSALHYQHREDDDWRPAVLRTIASEDEGIVELAAEIARHREHLATSGRLIPRRRQKTAALLRAAVEERLRAGLWQTDASKLLEQGVNNVIDGRISLRSAAAAVLDGAALPGATAGPFDKH
ncbi:MAG: hypothetical protein HKO62_01690, partial [Gammaproteobacteria bacterium]|nr:hypothetical protein [Gammaproteobacteria bacterium]